jgi:hypothetical protein
LSASALSRFEPVSGELCSELLGCRAGDDSILAGVGHDGMLDASRAQLTECVAFPVLDLSTVRGEPCYTLGSEIVDEVPERATCSDLG